MIISHKNNSLLISQAVLFCPAAQFSGGFGEALGSDAETSGSWRKRLGSELEISPLWG